METTVKQPPKKPAAAPLPDDPSPVFPKLPTTTAKNVTRVILILSSFAVGVGAWYAKEEEQDPETLQVIRDHVNVSGAVTAVLGVLGIVGGLFQQKQHTDQAEVAVAHVEAAKEVEVDQALAAPPVDTNGNESVEHTLNMALTQASQRKDFKAAAKILALIESLGSPPAAAVSGGAV